MGGISPQELRRLYAEHGSSIRGYCGRLLGDVASAEDAAHEVFLRVARFRGAVPSRAEVRPWLFRIATNYCLNELRRRRVRAQTTPRPWLLHPEDALLARSDLRGLLESLPPRACAVAWLTYVDGMLQQEVADTLGVSRRTVVSELHRIRAKCP